MTTSEQSSDSAQVPLDLIELVPPACQHGYPREQLEQIIAERADEFTDWMRGQTVALCDGRAYDHDRREYVPSGCSEPHGLVVYPHDVAQFIRGGEPLD